MDKINCLMECIKVRIAVGRRIYESKNEPETLKEIAEIRVDAYKAVLEDIKRIIKE